MSVLSYLQRAFPSVDTLAVADALLTRERVTECEDGRFIAAMVEGNRQVKIPSNMCGGCPVNLADRILLERGVQIGGSWAKTNSGKSSQHDRVAQRFLNRLSPPCVLEQLFTVGTRVGQRIVPPLTCVQIAEPSLRTLMETLVLRLRMSVSAITITRAFDEAMESPWMLNIPQSCTLARLCKAVAVYTVVCKREDACFVVDGKTSLKCAPKDWVFLTQVTQPPQMR